MKITRAAANQIESGAKSLRKQEHKELAQEMPLYYEGKLKLGGGTKPENHSLNVNHDVALLQLQLASPQPDPRLDLPAHRRVLPSR